MHINDVRLKTIEDAIYEARERLAPSDDPKVQATLLTLAKAEQACSDIRFAVASDTALDEGRCILGGASLGDSLSIDDDATVSEADSGYWISAWLWVPKQEQEAEAA